MDMGAILPDEDMPIAEYLVGSLDDKGYLSTSRSRTSPTSWTSTRTACGRCCACFRAQEPIGIGARNLRECLLIQIAHLEERGLAQPYAREIVSQFLTELGEHKFGTIAHELKISPRRSSRTSGSSSRRS